MSDNPELAKTLINHSVNAAENAKTLVAPSKRMTVLPRPANADGAVVRALAPNVRERFEEVAPLGQGGMGEVVLLKDHDIDRGVALKRLQPGAGEDQILRFVDEIRIVGNLEHPNIVPVHDVGIDDRGRYFFVMKHLKGETLESIILRLQKGDAEAHQRYPFAVRTQIFLGILHAVAYAHEQGVIHRDLKPANIMIGPFGEVTVMDWGLAKRLHAPNEADGISSRAPVDGAAAPLAAGHTQAGAIMGTPLYMSPEQAMGQTDLVDERTDTYALTVLFHELMYLEHYLDESAEPEKTLADVCTVEPDVWKTTPHPGQGLVSPEFGWFIRKGMDKDPAKRFQNVAEMIAALQRSMSASILIQCPRTLIKRVLQEVTRAADNHPYVAMVTTAAALAGLVFGAVKAVATLV